MKAEFEKYQEDILRAIDLIEEFIVGIETFEEYEKDLKSQSAVERQLVIIGEVLNKIKKQDIIKINNDVQIISFRNRLVHAYDSIDNAIVWAILKKHLPVLKTEVAEIQ